MPLKPNFTAKNESDLNPNELASDRRLTTIAVNNVMEPHQHKQIPQQPTQSLSFLLFFPTVTHALDLHTLQCGDLGSANTAERIRDKYNI